ncbi:MAG: sigma-70 family RNA polymerase sigma factor [Cyanobacteriota bacterium]
MTTRTSAPPRPFPHRSGRAPTLPPDLERRNALVEAHHHLVPPLARHYGLRCQEPKEDLIQVGWLGLIRAAELYQPTLRIPFPAFARPHIRGAILHYLRDLAASVRLPRRQCELQSRLARLEETMTAEGRGQAPGEEELLGRLGMTAEQWRLLRRHQQLCRPTLLDGQVLEQVAAPEEDPREEAHDLARLEGLLAGLGGRGELVVRRVVLQGWSYRRTAASLEVSAMTVQRCLHKSLATLREQLQNPAASGEETETLNPRRTLDRAPSAARGWPARHSPPPAGAPVRLARR